MLVTNNEDDVRYLFYKVAGVTKSARFKPFESISIPDLTSEEQITYNALEYKLKGINARFGRTFQLDFTLVSDDGEITTYLFRTVDLGTNTPEQLVTRDGARIIEFDGYLHLLGGWNPVEFSATTASTNQHWITDNPDDASSWVRLADAPWLGSHDFGCETDGNYIYKIGHDVQHPGRSAHRYSTASGWELVTNDMGTVWGDRYSPTVTIHKGYFYAIGGGTGGPGTYHYDVIRATTALNDWIKVGELPVDDYWAGNLESVGDDLIFWGAGSYLGQGAALNSNVFKSSDDGVTWDIIATLPAAMRGTYVDSEYWDGKLWHLNGFGEGGLNMFGLFYSSDLGINWTRLYDNPIRTHASGFATFQDKLYRVTGNFDNFSYSVEKAVVHEPNIPSGATAIYSIRNHESFSGQYAFQVQRSSDNELMDIGFVDDNIDEDAMTIFMGSSSLFVSIHYDRTGNGNHLSNSIGSRPLVGENGVLKKVNGKIGLFHSGGTICLNTSSDIDMSNVHSAFGVMQLHSYDREFVGGPAGNYMMYSSPTNSNIYNSNGSSGFGIGGSQWPLSSQTLWTTIRNDTVIQRYKDGLVNLCSWSIDGNNSFLFRSPSGEANSTFRFIGYYQELIIYPSDMKEHKSSIESNMATYYNITLSAS